MRKVSFKGVLENLDTTCESFLDEVSDGIYLLDGDGCFLYVNRAIQERTGLSFDQLVGMNYLDIVSPENHKGLQGLFDRIMRGKDVPPYEASYKGPKGETRYVELNSRPVLRQGKIVGVQGVSRDITGRVRAESALRRMNEELEARVEERTRELVRANRQLEVERDSLRKSEKTIRALLNAVTEVVFLVAVDGTILALNDRAAQRFGADGRTAVGMNLRDFIEPDILERRLQWAVPAIESGRPVVFEDERQGKTFRTNVYPVKDSDGLVGRFAVFGKDITVEKAAEKKLLAHQKKLRSLASQLSLAEERQRRRIAVEVHDRIGQNLAFAKMKLADLRRRTSEDDTLAVAEAVTDLVDRAIRDTRALVSNLGSPVLHEMGFVPAVEGLCRDIEKRHGRLAILFRSDEASKPLAEDVQILLFQSIREALANALKHARAGTVEVRLEVEGDGLRIVISDDGVGFDPETLNEMIHDQESFGIFSIQQRLESLDGRLEIDSAPGEGTRVTMKAPLAKETFA